MARSQKKRTIKQLMGVSKRQINANDVEFMSGYINGDISSIKRAMKNGINPAINHNNAIIVASRNNHRGVVSLLLQDSRVDPSDRNNQAIIEAAESGHVEIVRVLLADSRVDPSAQDNKALKKSQQNKHINVVELLLQAQQTSSTTNLTHNKPQTQQTSNTTNYDDITRKGR